MRTSVLSLIAGALLIAPVAFAQAPRASVITGRPTEYIIDDRVYVEGEVPYAGHYQIDAPTPQEKLYRVIRKGEQESPKTSYHIAETPDPATHHARQAAQDAPPAQPRGSVITQRGMKTLPTTEMDVLNIKDMTMGEFARLLSQGAGWKIIVSRDAGNITFRTYFEDITGEDAIRAICQANNLWFHKDTDNGIISIMTVEEYRKGILSHSQDTVKVVTLLYPDARAVGDAIQRLFKNRVVWTPPDEFYDNPLEDIESAFERMETMTDQVQNIQSAFNRNSSMGRSGSSSRSSSRSRSSSSSRSGQQRRNTDPMADNQIVEDIEQDIPPERMIAQLAGMAGEMESPLGEPGIVYVSAFRGSNDLLLRSSDPKAVDEVMKVIAKLDKPKPQVLLEVKVLDIRLNDDESYGLDWLFKAGDASGARSLGLNSDTMGANYGNILKPADGSLLPAGTGLDPKAMVLQVVTNDIAARIQAMQDSGRVVSLATPNLCVADGEASRIFVGTETTVLTSVTVDKSTYNGTSTTTDTTYNPETERLNVGTTLLITPRIHADRTTTIRIAQEDSQVGDTQEIVFGQTETGGSQSFYSKDINTRTVVTTVVAADGQISAIGGLIREVAEDRDVGVPGLMSVPYLGTLFKTTQKSRQRHELLVLIRPFILLAPGEAEPASQEFIERISEHPSAHGMIPSLRIGEGVTVVNERVYEIPKQALKAVKMQAQPWSTEGR